jgi:hypothetical protein
LRPQVVESNPQFAADALAARAEHLDLRAQRRVLPVQGDVAVIVGKVGRRLQRGTIAAGLGRRNDVEGEPVPADRQRDALLPRVALGALLLLSYPLLLWLTGFFAPDEKELAVSLWRRYSPVVRLNPKTSLPSGK